MFLIISRPCEQKKAFIAILVTQQSFKGDVTTRLPKKVNTLNEESTRKKLLRQNNTSSIISKKK